VRRPYVIHCRLSFEEISAFKAMCRRHNLVTQDMLRALIVDAVAEEEDVLQRRQQTGRESGREGRKGCGVAA